MCWQRCNCSSKSCKWVSRRNYRPLWSQKNGQKYNRKFWMELHTTQKTGTIFLTGKNWDKIFEITVSEQKKYDYINHKHKITSSSRNRSCQSIWCRNGHLPTIKRLFTARTIWLLILVRCIVPKVKADKTIDANENDLTVLGATVIPTLFMQAIASRSL
jgi:hypothetical protein